MDHQGTVRGLVALPIAALLSLSAPAAVAAHDDGLQAARDYCTSVGGEVQVREATWNTNSDVSQWVDLGRSMELCRFKADDEAGSRIYVDLLTLYTETPTLASAAYLAAPPMRDDLPPGNPATWYCADLAGSAQYGSGAGGGGWVAMDDPDDVVVGLCVFPDGSAIDEWGLAYHSDGTIRGADLEALFRADVAAFPPMFGESAAAVDTTEGPATTDGVGTSTGTPTATQSLAAAGAVEAPISTTSGGVVEVTNADGTVTTIAFPAGSAPADMTVVVTPLSELSTDKGDPLTPGVLVEQKGNEGQHLQLASPAIVTFALKGKVPDEAAVVTFTDPETAQPLASSVSRQGKSTMVTAFVPAFSPMTVDGDPGAWGDLASLVPDHRWSLTMSGVDTQKVQNLELSLSADGVLTSTALTGTFAFNGMSGPIDLGVAASFEEGPIAGTLDSTRIKGEGKLYECWVQVANRKKGTFWLRGNGDLSVEGSATITAQASLGGKVIKEGLDKGGPAAVKIGVKASGVPAKVGDSVPATFTIYDGRYAWKYKSTLTWVSK